MQVIGERRELGYIVCLIGSDRSFYHFIPFNLHNNNVCALRSCHNLSSQYIPSVTAVEVKSGPSGERIQALDFPRVISSKALPGGRTQELKRRGI